MAGWTVTLCGNVIVFFILCGFYGEINASRDIPRRTTAAEKQAEFLKSLEDYDIVHPYVTDESGSHVTSDLREIHTPRRHRRALSSRGEGGLPARLYMAVNVSRNERLHLNLTHRPDFLAEGFVIERRRGRNISLSEVTLPSKHHRCQYRGHLLYDTNGKVALSVCSGLRGMIWSGGEEYFIEPVVGHVTKSSRHHPHVIYKRSAIPGDDVIYADAKRLVEEGIKRGSEESCGVTGDLADHERNTVEGRDEEVEGHHRSRRSISHERFVETLVVVDHNMYDYYHDLDVETYTLTIMNMVTALYHDASLGNLVNIVLVKLMILTEPEVGLNISHHADNSLRSFCSWQRDINTAYGGGDEHENHHDTALLFTRKDICRRLDQPCSTLGLAFMSGMCVSHRTCTINEDSGLGMAYTVAHEMGHLFGINHDGQSNDCRHPAPGTSQLMAGQLNGHRGPMKWSRCSKAYMSRFLDRGWGDCLLDEPSPRKRFNFPKLPAGVMYSADYQCELLFKKNATLCSLANVQRSTMCTTLWCQVDNFCNSKTIPAAPGTACGENMWCYDGECVAISKPPPPIPGDWGEWSEWTECSRTCGGGVSIQERHCDNPAPANGGRYCQGKRKNYALCNLQSCPEGSVGFREQQCSYYDNIQYQGRYWEWLPVIEPGNECSLSCRRKYLRHIPPSTKAQAVADGTTCGKELKDICINGICYKVGCDQRIGSSAVEDICGVCHGDGSSCKQISEEFNNTVVPGPVKITVIPAHARSISVEEKYESLSYMDLQDMEGRSIFNSYRHGFNVDGEYTIDNGKISGIYVRQGSMEKLTVKGPLPEPINIVCNIRTRYPSIGYRYYLPKPENETDAVPEKFVWQYDEWSPCSTTCGNGTQRSVVHCVRLQPFSFVEDSYCNDTKPDDEQQSCNEHSCPASWWIGPWQSCSATCGNGVTRRSVFCIKSISPDEQMAISDEACIEHGAEEKPNVSMECNNFECPSEADWNVGEWSECSSTCGEGTQNRHADCIRADDRCEFEHRPQTERSCEAPCPHEFSSSYDNDLPPNADYSYSYGDGQVNTFGGWEDREAQMSKNRGKHRNQPEQSNVLMSDELWTDSERRNSIGGKHSLLDSDTATLKKWITGDWSQCSVSCGSGSRSRTVSCVIADTTTETVGCSDHNRPSSAEICHHDALPKATDDCKDTLAKSFCQITEQSGSCSLPAFKKACCATCSNGR